MTSVDLASGRIGAVSVTVHAEIVGNGDLHVTRQDFGPRASMTGADEAEKVVAIDQRDKDRLLLALLEAQFGGHTDAQDQIVAYAASKGIEISQFRWP